MEDIIQAGTALTIDDEFLDSVVSLCVLGLITGREYEEWNNKFETLKLPVLVKFYEYRKDREKIVLGWSIVEDKHLFKLNDDLTIFRKIGYRIIEPKQITMPLSDADDDLLTPREMVLKYLIKENAKAGKHRVWCEAILSKVEQAMKQCGVIFYKS